jgi:ABC-type tungstate transport system permease subunit
LIQKQTNSCRDNIFKIGWVKGDTTKTINNLKAGHVHVGITYHKVAEQIAIDTGSAKGCMYEDDSKHPCFTDCKNATEKPCYTVRDHFYLVGPRENPADVEKDDNIINTFKKIYETGERGKARFLTRFDKSATNIKHSEM